MESANNQPLLNHNDQEDNYTPAQSDISMDSTQNQQQQQKSQQEHYQEYMENMQQQGNGVPISINTTAAAASPTSPNNCNNKGNNAYAAIQNVVSPDFGFHVDLTNELKLYPQAGELVWSMRDCCGTETSSNSFPTRRIPTRFISSITVARFRDTKAAVDGFASLLFAIAMAVAGPLINKHISGSIFGGGGSSQSYDPSGTNSIYYTVVPTWVVAAMTVLHQMKSILKMLETIWNAIVPACLATYATTFNFKPWCAVEPLIISTQTFCGCHLYARGKIPPSKFIDAIAAVTSSNSRQHSGTSPRAPITSPKQQETILLNDVENASPDDIKLVSSPHQPNKYYVNFTVSAGANCCTSNLLSINSEYVKLETGDSRGNLAGDGPGHELEQTAVFLSDIAEVQIARQSVAISPGIVLAVVFLTLASAGLAFALAATNPNDTWPFAFFAVPGFFFLVLLILSCRKNDVVSVFTTADLQYYYYATPSLVIPCVDRASAVDVANTIRHAQHTRLRSLQQGGLY